MLEFLNHLTLINSLGKMTWGEIKRCVGHRVMIKCSFPYGQPEDGHWEEVVNGLMEYLFFVVGISFMEAMCLLGSW